MPVRTPPGLPFAHLNLRRNPFGEATRAERAALAVASDREVDGWVERLGGARFALQLVGDCGRGKTTHLLALHARFPAAPFTRLEPDLPARVDPAPLVFVDEAQLLPARRRRALFRACRALALATHEDLQPELQAAGLEVETVRLTGLDPARLAAILTRRLEWARRGPGPIPWLADDACARLVARFGDDVRAIEDHLYGVFQQLDQVRQVNVALEA